MPLVVGEQALSAKFIAENWQTTLTALLSLPQPKVVEFDDARSRVDPDKTVICIQREAAYIDQERSGNKITHAGTIKLGSCIGVYIFNDQEHVFIHVDDTTNYQFDRWFGLLRKKENLKCILIGALAGEKQSDKNIYNVINALAGFLETNQINLTITTQKILQNNIGNESSVYEAIYDQLILFGQLIFQTYFEKKIPERFFDEFSPASLKRDIHDVDYGFVFLYLYMGVWFGDGKDFLPKVEYKHLLKNENIFLKAYRKFFSVAGYELIKTSQKGVKLPKLANFVFDIHTKEAFIIPLYLKKVNFLQRYARFKENTSEIPRYFLCYDSSAGGYQTPRVTEKRIKFIKQELLMGEKFPSWPSRMMDKLSDETSAIRAAVSKEIFDLIWIARGMVIEEKEAKKLEQNKQQLYAYVKGIQDTVFSENSFTNESANHTIKHLREITQKHFVVKTRAFSEKLQDAVLFCKDKAEAEGIVAKLTKENIISHVLCKNEAANLYHVWVPAINAPIYRDNILKARLTR